MLLHHNYCPFCHKADFHQCNKWEHLLVHCPVTSTLAEDWDLEFLPDLCTTLGIPLTIYTACHHVAKFTLHMLQHLHTLPQTYKPEATLDTGSHDAGHIHEDQESDDDASRWLSSPSKEALDDLDIGAHRDCALSSPLPSIVSDDSDFGPQGPHGYIDVSL